MNIYLCSSSNNYTTYWNNCIVGAKIIDIEYLSKLSSSDILVVDYRLYCDGLNTNAKLIVLDSEPTYIKCMKLLENSVKAYGNIYMHESHILSSIESVKDGKIWIYPNFLTTMIIASKKSHNSNVDEKIVDLTPREKEIAKLILDGLSNKEIAIKLEISINTIKIHTKNIYNKLNVSDRLALFSLLNK